MGRSATHVTLHAKVNLVDSELLQFNKAESSR